MKPRHHRRASEELGIATAAQALDPVAAYFPRRLIAAKTQFGIEELFAKPAGEP